MKTQQELLAAAEILERAMMAALASGARDRAMIVAMVSSALRWAAGADDSDFAEFIRDLNEIDRAKRSAQVN